MRSSFTVPAMLILASALAGCPKADRPPADLDCVEPSCVDAPPLRCESNEACEPGLRCVEGTCTTCSAASDCPTGICHESGYCEPPPCATDDACPTAEACDGSQCLPYQIADPMVCGVASVAFARDSAKLSPGNQERLAQATPCLLEKTSVATLDIAGNADGLGSDDYQRALAQRRAASIHAFLVGRGLPEDRVRVLDEPASDPRRAQLTLAPM